MYWFTVLLLSLVVGTSGASPLRRLDQDAAVAFEYNDLTNFGIRFERCQYVKMFDDELAQEENSASVLALKHFVIYKLCPQDECSSCDGTHGLYVVDVEDYLQATIEYEKQAFEYMCQNCNDNCNNGQDCTGCGDLCYQYDNLEANGYVDASEYIECQQVDNGDDDGGNVLYVGPRCSSSNNEIKIGLFSDEDCSVPYDDQEIEDVLGVKLSYHILKSVQSNDEESLCLSCAEMEDENQNNANDNADADDVNEMCEQIYEASGKCESIYGLETGFVQMNREEDEYENQVENEFMVCGFIDSLLWNSYTETGEINVQDEQDVIIRTMMPLQKVVLSLLTITFVALLGSVYYLHHQIEKHSPKSKVALSAQTPGKEVI